MFAIMQGLKLTVASDLRRFKREWLVVTELVNVLVAITADRTTDLYNSSATRES
jgi:hypothetical protein